MVLLEAGHWEHALEGASGTLVSIILFASHPQRGEKLYSALPVQCVSLSQGQLTGPPMAPNFQD